MIESTPSEKLRLHRSRRKGATLWLVLIMLPTMLLLAGFAINYSYMEYTQTEMQVATDAAARAAGREYSLTGDVKEALAAANQAGSLNLVAGKPLKFDKSDLELGVSVRPNTSSRYIFTPGGSRPNAIRLSGKRTSSSANGTVNFLFPSVNGSNSFEPVVSTTSTQVELDIAIVLDRSGSMAYSTEEVAQYPPNPSNAPAGWEFGHEAPPNARWHDLVEATNSFLATLNTTPQSEQVTLVTYADWGYIDQELTYDYTKVQTKMDGYTKNLYAGGTNIGDGIAWAVKALNDPDTNRYWASKVIVVMTDGKQNWGCWPNWQAEQAFKQGVMVFSITFSDEADQPLMIETASRGGGAHFHADKKEDLIRVFQEIGQNLPTMITN